VPSAAQDTPIGAPGLEVATEQTPAATASTDALRKATQNPVASLISVPIQNNSNFGVGPDDRTQNVVNIQPVIPVGVSANWLQIRDRSFGMGQKNWHRMFDLPYNA
jgi:hypothetical protein